MRQPHGIRNISCYKKASVGFQSAQGGHMEVFCRVEHVFVQHKP